MQIALPESTTDATLILDPAERLTDAQYFDFCIANPDLEIERTATGEIEIAPPAGSESDYRNAEVIYFLKGWSKQDKRGRSFGSSAQFILPDGSALSPDAAWVANERLAGFTKLELRRFPRLVSDFIIEVLSPSDRLAKAPKKMSLWAANGVELGWLIDGDKQQVHIYRGTTPPRILSGIDNLAGEGFTLPLTEIWEGL